MIHGGFLQCHIELPVMRAWFREPIKTGDDWGDGLGWFMALGLPWFTTLHDALMQYIALVH